MCVSGSSQLCGLSISQVRAQFTVGVAARPLLFSDCAFFIKSLDICLQYRIPTLQHTVSDVDVPHTAITRDVSALPSPYFSPTPFLLTLRDSMCDFASALCTDALRIGPWTCTQKSSGSIRPRWSYTRRRSDMCSCPTTASLFSGREDMAQSDAGPRTT